MLPRQGPQHDAAEQAEDGSSCANPESTSNPIRIDRDFGLMEERATMAPTLTSPPRIMFCSRRAASLPLPFLRKAPEIQPSTPTPTCPRSACGATTSRTRLIDAAESRRPEETAESARRSTKPKRD
jgi:hypothetical protein